MLFCRLWFPSSACCTRACKVASSSMSPPAEALLSLSLRCNVGRIARRRHWRQARAWCGRGRAGPSAPPALRLRRRPSRRYVRSRCCSSLTPFQRFRGRSLPAQRTDPGSARFTLSSSAPSEPGQRMYRARVGFCVRTKFTSAHVIHARSPSKRVPPSAAALRSRLVRQRQ